MTFLFCTDNPKRYNSYPMELAVVQDLLVLSTKLPTNSNISGLECRSILWY